MRINCTKIVLYGVCIIVGLSFAWWVTALRIENADAKRAEQELVYTPPEGSKMWREMHEDEVVD